MTARIDSNTVPGDSLAFFRRCFGLLVLWQLVSTLFSGRLEAWYHKPQFAFHYPGFSWLHALPAAWLELATLSAMAAAAVLAVDLAGLVYRVAASYLTLFLCYLFLLEETRYLNHGYLICLLAILISVLPRGAQIPRRALFVMRWQIAVVYIFAGIAKIDRDWLEGWPLHDWLTARSQLPVLGPLLTLESTALFMAWSGMLFDLLIVPGLLYRRTRSLALAAAIVFHMTNALLFSIGVFPWLALAAATLFFEPAWPERQLGLTLAQHSDRFRLPAARALAVVWLAIQTLLPLRHWLYPGDVAWTEEGHRFSWRMMLRSKRGELAFVLRSPDGRLTYVDPQDEVEPWQARKLATRPDLILQYAQHLAQRADSNRKPGALPIEVRAVGRVSLNGRIPRPLVDPSVDLARVHMSLATATWILRELPARRIRDD